MFKIVAFDMNGTIADAILICIKAFRNSVSPYTDHERESVCWKKTNERFSAFSIN